MKLVKIQMYFFSKVMQSGDAKLILFTIVSPNYALVYEKFIEISLTDEKLTAVREILLNLLNLGKHIQQDAPAPKSEKHAIMFVMEFISAVVDSVASEPDMMMYMQNVLTEYAQSDHAAEMVRSMAAKCETTVAVGAASNSPTGGEAAQSRTTTAQGNTSKAKSTPAVGEVLC